MFVMSMHFCLRRTDTGRDGGDLFGPSIPEHPNKVSKLPAYKQLNEALRQVDLKDILLVPSETPKPPKQLHPTFVSLCIMITSSPPKEWAFPDPTIDIIMNLHSDTMVLLVWLTVVVL